MVVFKHPGLAEAGIWSYHAKLYPNSDLMGSGNKMTVDVVSRANNAEAAPVVMEVFTSVHQADEVRQFKISGNLFIKKSSHKIPQNCVQCAGIASTCCHLCLCYQKRDRQPIKRSFA